MKYRRLSVTGDYTFGSDAGNFVHDIQATAQAIKTRLDLYRGAFWRDRNDGLPLFQSILPSPGSPQNLQVVDDIIKRRILGTQNVTDLTYFQSRFNPDTRHYELDANAQTTFSSSIHLQEIF
jgi:hypothetical protein